MLTLPNLLTLSRLLALPVVIILYRTNAPVAAAAVFLLAMLTDCLDGWLARRLNQASTLGLYLDPVVDKTVILVLFYEFGAARLLPLSVAHLFLLRELLQSGVRSAAAVQGHVVGANWMGKSKAALQTTLITWGLLLPWLATSAPQWSAHLDALWVWLCWAVLLLSWVFLAIFLYWNRALLGLARPKDACTPG